MSTAQSRRVRVAVATVLASALLAGATQAQNFNHDHDGPSRDDDPVVFSFATVGDSRQDPATPDPTTLLEAGEPGTFSSGATLGTASQPGKPDLTGTLLPQDATFLTDTKPFARILRGIQREKPNLLFFNGDMIYGYGRPGVPAEAITSVQGNAKGALTYTDAVFEYRQYAYWRGIVAPLFETGTYVVPVPGNHETECKSSVSHDMTCVKGTHPTVDNENAYRDNLGDLVEDVYTNERFQAVSGFPAIAANGFSQATAPNASANNGAVSNVNESELSYSFDIRLDSTRQLLHFVVVNTDPTGADATAPTDWLAQDMEDAKSRAAANHLTPKYFVFGHKPAFTYGYNVVTAAPASAYDPYAANGLDAPSSATTPSTLNSTAAATKVSVKQANGNIVTIATNVPQILVDAKPQYVAATTTGSGSALPVTPAPFASTVPYPLVNLFWSVIAHYDATYFCGHEHIPHVEQFKDVTGASKSTPYQVIVGSGGSPFDAAMSSDNPPREPVPLTNWQDRYYAWATVQVHRSGTVSLQVQGFTDGAKYDPSTGVVSKLGVDTPAQPLWVIPHLQ
jgi:Calcineurin-like phosphoesterase